MEWSARAEVVYRRSYSRPLDEAGSQFETWQQTINRVIRHQGWLWERAKGMNLSSSESAELEALQELFLDRKMFPAGRTLWLGGTELSRIKESCSFNCSGLSIKTVFDIVDAMWLLLQGAGVGFTPVAGILNGFIRPIDEIEIIRSTRKFKGGAERNTETWVSSEKLWIIQVGDSAKAWAKAIGKLIAGKYPARKLVLDLSQIRPAGDRLRGYGWISSGDKQLAVALEGICQVMNGAAGRLLTVIDILDIVNWMGTILSSRRSAELCQLPITNKLWRDFALAKKDHYSNGQIQRGQSNNSIAFYAKPSKSQLFELFDLMLEGGGSEPGFINGETALKRAPYYCVQNPCSEVLLGDHGFCNLSELVAPRFNGDFDGMLKAIGLLARANYRQSCVNLDDGVLQRTWHELNEYLHLCGVGMTGLVQWEGVNNESMLQRLYATVRKHANQMADELDLPHPTKVTVVKPSGTLSKVAECSEGIHTPIGRYIFNNINFSEHDPLVEQLEKAGYKVWTNPNDHTGRLVTFPQQFDHVNLPVVNGIPVNMETALDQLERYKLFMDNYVDMNVSCTISYTPGEIGRIVDWIHKNWESYVATAFMLKMDVTKTAEDMGYAYLPQEVVTEARFFEYTQQLRPLDLSKSSGDFDIDTGECVGGSCPIR